MKQEEIEGLIQQHESFMRMYQQQKARYRSHGGVVGKVLDAAVIRRYDEAIDLHQATANALRELARYKAVAEVAREIVRSGLPITNWQLNKLSNALAEIEDSQDETQNNGE